MVEGSQMAISLSLAHMKKQATWENPGINLSFQLIGISSQAPIYRFAWHMNTQFGFGFVATALWAVPAKSNWLKEKQKASPQSANSLFSFPDAEEEMNEVSEHMAYSWQNDEMATHFLLLANEGTHTHLAPEWKQFDFFLKLESDYANGAFLAICCEKIRSLPFISAAETLDPKKAKNPINLSEALPMPTPNPNSHEARTRHLPQ